VPRERAHLVERAGHLLIRRTVRAAAPVREVPGEEPDAHGLVWTRVVVAAADRAVPAVLRRVARTHPEFRIAIRVDDALVADLLAATGSDQRDEHHVPHEGGHPSGR